MLRLKATRSAERAVETRSRPAPYRSPLNCPEAAVGTWRHPLSRSIRQGRMEHLFVYDFEGDGTVGQRLPAVRAGGNNASKERAAVNASRTSETGRSVPTASEKT